MNPSRCRAFIRANRDYPGEQCPDLGLLMRVPVNRRLGDEYGLVREPAQPPQRAAEPIREELKDFRNARISDDLRIVRSELVADGMLAAAGVGFDFGARGGTPQPDLVLREISLGIEIKNRTFDGLRELERNLDAAVADLGAPGAAPPGGQEPMAGSVPAGRRHIHHRGDRARG